MFRDIVIEKDACHSLNLSLVLLILSYSSFNLKGFSENAVAQTLDFFQPHSVLSSVGGKLA